MIFKQGVLKQLRVQEFMPFAALNLVVGGLLIWIGLHTANSINILIFLLILYSPLFLLMLFLGFVSLEWYHIYNDRIEVRYIFGRKNVVYYDKVLFVEEVELAISRSVYIKFYIFNDGRKNNNNFLDYNSCKNKKKFNLRIYKTDKLENFVKNTLNLTVKKK